MKQMEMDSHAPFLPQEIITNILLRLPVISLLRFQCVCKEWKNLFKTPSFIAAHLHHGIHRNPFLLFKCYVPREPYHYFLLNGEKDFQEFRNIPLPNSKSIVRGLHSNHGLLCLELIYNDKFHSFLLYNPATREVRKVPRRLRLFKEYDFWVGFGFNPFVNDYKIVRLFVSLDDGKVDKVEVYSLSTGSWKEVEVGIFGDVKFGHVRSLCANGAIFWVGHTIEWEPMIFSNWIISFDLTLEVSTLIPLPVEMDGKLRDCSLTMYENKLALLCPTDIENPVTTSIDLWVMEEGTGETGEKWSWTKKYTTSPFPCPDPWKLCPKTIWRNEIVCSIKLMPIALGEVKNDDEKIVKFNLTTNEYESCIVGCLCKFDHEMFNYAESLVPLRQHHIEEL